MEYIIANLREMLFKRNNNLKKPLQMVKRNRKYIIKTKNNWFFNTCVKVTVLELTNTSILFKKHDNSFEEKRMALTDFNEKYLVVEDLDYDVDYVDEGSKKVLNLMERVDKLKKSPIQLKPNNDYIVKNVGYYGYNTTNRIRVLQITDKSILFIEMDDGDKIRLDIADFNSFYTILEQIKY